jgi:two-component system chemotaxis response regulator CheB
MTDRDSPVRVVIIDDSAFGRQALGRTLAADPAIQVVGRASDGDEGLKQVLLTQPDVVTLDLEMPRMDGFTFLRLLMAQRPTPVLVISSYGAQQNVFRALELGALDFIVKPGRLTEHLADLQAELIRKIKLVRAAHLPPSAPAQPPTAVPAAPPARAFATAVPPTAATPALGRLVAIGASTGGPPALVRVLASFGGLLPAPILIAQHMPPRFTGPFAERLGRATGLAVREAQPGLPIVPGEVLVAPGTGSLVVGRRADGALEAQIEPPGPDGRFVPSIDRLFASAARACGPGVLAVVLTGMGGDGAKGVRAVKAAGGRVVAEADETAVIFGMPGEAIATGAVDEILPLPRVGEAIARFAAGSR